MKFARDQLKAAQHREGVKSSSKTLSGDYKNVTSGRKYVNKSIKHKHNLGLSSIKHEFEAKWLNDLDRKTVKHIVKGEGVNETKYPVGKVIRADERFNIGDYTIVACQNPDVTKPVVIHNCINEIEHKIDPFIQENNVEAYKGENLIYTVLQGSLIKTLIDSGSMESSIRIDLVNSLGIRIVPLRQGEPNFSMGIAGEIPILGRCIINISFLDICPGPFSFKIIPKLDETTDSLVLGIDYLMHMGLKINGYNNMIKGETDNGLNWLYYSNDNEVRRIMCDVDCRLKGDLSLRQNEQGTVEIECAKRVENKAIKINNFESEPRFINFVVNNELASIDGELDSVDRKLENGNINYFIINIERPEVVLCNPTNEIISYNKGQSIGKLYSIYTMPIGVGTREIGHNMNLSNDDIFKCLIKQEVSEADIYSFRRSGIDEQDIEDLPQESEWSRETLFDRINIGEEIENNRQDFLEMMWKYKNTVSNYKTVPASKIPPVKLICDTDQAIFTPQYRHSSEIRQELDKIFAELLKANIVEFSSSKHNSPIHAVTKKDGTIRPTIDMRAVNKHLIVEPPAPMISLETLLMDIQGMKVMSNFDLLLGYLQLPLSPESRELTAFTLTHRMQYTRLPFGCKASGICFNKLINKALAELIAPIQLPGDKNGPRRHLFLFVDDGLIVTENAYDHMIMIDLIMKKLSEYELKLKLDKCHWFMKEVKFLGYMISGSGIKKDEKYVNAICELPLPPDVKSLMSFIGSVIYLHKFLPGFADVAKPLTQMTSSNRSKMREKIVWDETKLKAFEAVRELVKRDVELSYPRFNDVNNPLKLFTDASSQAAGSCLMQTQDGVDRIIAFHSTTFSKTERAYSVTELELLALKLGIQAFEVFLKGNYFVAYTDHAPLLHLTSLKNFNGRITRTLEYLSNFNFSTVWIPGRENIISDMLSRTPQWSNNGENVPNLEIIENYEYLPEGIEIGYEPNGGGNSILRSLMWSYKGLNNDMSGITESSIHELRLKLFDHIHKNLKKYKVGIDSKNRQAWTALKNVNSPLPHCFIQAFANLYKVNVHMYYGYQTPLIFECEKGSKEIRNIYIQSIANCHYNALIYKGDGKMQNSNCNIKQTWTDLCSLEADEDIVDINVFDIIEKNEKLLENNDTSTENNTKTIDKFVEKTNNYHEESYVDWYKKRCGHNIVYDSFIPIKLGGTFFCACADNGSSCSILTISTAKKLFHEGKISKVRDMNVKILGAGGAYITVKTRIVAVDLEIGTCKFSNSLFMILPDHLLRGCALIGNDILNKPGMSMDFKQMAILYKNKVIIEMGRLKKPVFKGHEHYYTEKRCRAENINNRYDFLPMHDLYEIQQGNFLLRQLSKIMRSKSFVLPKNMYFLSKIKQHLVLKNEVIYYNKPGEATVPLMPTNAVITVALKLHDQHYHCGREKLTSLVSKILYHTRLDELIGYITSACQVCLLRKVHTPNFKPPIIKLESRYPFEMVVGDLVHMPQCGPYKYMFTVVDHYSKYGAACPLKDKSSATVAKAFKEKILPTFVSNPFSFHSDLGIEFVGKAFRDMLAETGIKQLNSLPYRPESHGSGERYNRSILELIRIKAEVNDNWPEEIPDAVRTYNTTRHRALKMSPTSFLLTKQHEINNKNILRDKDIKFWRKGHPGFKSFKKGDLVMKVIPRRGNCTAYKLQHLYAGPYVVIHTYPGGITYDVRSTQDYSCAFVVHHAQLRSWVKPHPILLKNSDYRFYYDLTKPLTPLEETKWTREGDPLETRQVPHANWRPVDIDCPDERAVLQVTDEDELIYSDEDTGQTGEDKDEYRGNDFITAQEQTFIYTIPDFIYRRDRPRRHAEGPLITRDPDEDYGEIIHEPLDDESSHEEITCITETTEPQYENIDKIVGVDEHRQTSVTSHEEHYRELLNNAIDADELSEGRLDIAPRRSNRIRGPPSRMNL
ncbi:unnamed protein product [Rotaria magnacalcarata]|uniref:RNA-directed DNA polymerase n=1 Tax=Rotaria magnacalcarata TaxID=392030 RepID=A0A816YZ31_9BILA|nr:unnamed protein product [Rotaria magnacalcarata]